MSFISYKYIRHLEFDSKTDLYSYEFEITDSEWVEVVVMGGSGVSGLAGARGAGCTVIDAYEKRDEPVVPNLVLAFQYAAKQYGHTIDHIINWHEQYSLKYLKYEQEVQKYLMLL